MIVDNLFPGEYTFAAWDKEALAEEELVMPGRRIQVYPNPALGSVRVYWSGLSDGYVCVIGADGRELKRLEYTQAEGVEIVIEGLPKGCYAVARYGKDGERLATEKLIIK